MSGIDNTPKKEVVLPSGIKVKPIYGPEDVKGMDYKRDLGDAGEYPYTRGIYPLMYRDRPWIIRQYSGFSAGEDTNTRLKFLMQRGVTGLSLAFGLPSQMGLDSDHPLAEDEVGRAGVAIDTLRDMEDIFNGIPLGKVNTNMTINATASIMLAMYVAAAEKQGVPHDQVKCTIQNDILKEYIARGAWIYPLKPSMRLIGDTIEYCNRELPNVNALSVSSGHIRFAGTTAAHEAGYALLIANAYVEHLLGRGMNIDDIGERITFSCSGGMNFFEDIAKYRALRRSWAKNMKERFGAKNPRSMRFVSSGGGGNQELTKQEPENNIIRETMYALAAALGGVQAMTMPGYMEAYSIPTPKAQQLATRTSQILIEESGITDTVDPLGGSYYVEWLTNEMEKRIKEIMAEVEEKGGILEAIEKGYIQRQVAAQAYLYQRKIESGELVKVGVNKYATEGEADLELHEYDSRVRDAQIERLKKVKAGRDNSRVERILKDLGKAAGGKDNLMPHIMEAVKAYATVGEISGKLQEKFGLFKEPVTF